MQCKLKGRTFRGNNLAKSGTTLVPVISLAKTVTAWT